MSTAPAVDQGDRIAVGFCRVLRRAGLRVPASATINFGESLGLLGVEDRAAVYWAGRSTLIHRPEDLALYDRVFAAFWEHRVGDGVRIEGTPPPVTLALDSDDEDDEPDDEDEVEPSDDVQAVRFSRAEVLTNKDFADCTKEELSELSTLMSRLRFTTYRRRSRRQVPSGVKGERPDLRRTVRWALRHQGEPMRRAFTVKATRPRRLVLIVDVSGSMEPYARALLRFGHAAVVARGRVEVFVLGTRLTRLTKHLTSRDPDAAIRRAFPLVKDWAGGTRLGEGIRAFNQEWGIRGMARGAGVVVLSDGWDRGDVHLLGDEMERLHRVTHQTVWVNPLKATPGYAPLAAGMSAALPHVDLFIEGHSYASLEQLAAILAGDGGRNG
ncbi:MAG: VWA domain-containing protein [Actinomycetia bacterium]|nr:VWA domain-containing protein [Actinomycetes bacterium]